MPNGETSRNKPKPSVLLWITICNLDLIVKCDESSRKRAIRNSCVPTIGRGAVVRPSKFHCIVIVSLACRLFLK